MSQVDEYKVKAEEAPKTKQEKEQSKSAGEYESQLGKNSHLLEVKVSSPYVTYFEDNAFSVSAENSSGPFDVLPGHHNFISLLNPCTMVIRDKANFERKVKISGGVMHVKADKVIVFLDV